MNIMKKFLPLIAVAALFLYPNQSAAQSYEDWYNFGAAIGSATRRAVDNAKQKREEEARRQREAEERERQYQLEQQRLENERIMAQQRAEEERRRAEEERRIRAEEERRIEQERRMAEEARKAEETRIKRIEAEKQKEAEAAIEKKAAEEDLNLYNSSAHILSPQKEAIFLTSDGHELILFIQSDKLLYKNYSEKEELVICNNVSIKIKYANEPNEETLNDACQIKLQPTGSSYGEIPLSDVFFNISSFKEIEFVKIRLSDTKIRSGKRIQNVMDLNDETQYKNNETTPNGTFIDLGLPSKTLWKNDNEQGFYTYDEAVSKFGNKLPTKDQYSELKQYCSWSWTGSGYKVTGPNGNSITLPAAGYRDCDGSVDGVGSYGYYLSTTPNGSDSAWYLLFYSSRVDVSHSLRCFGRPVRLVQDK